MPQEMMIGTVPAMLPGPFRLQPTAAVLLLTVVLIGIEAGCAGGGGSGPQLSGFGIGDSRSVSVGEMIDMRLPLREDGSREWRVTSWDSRYISIASRPEFITGANGRPEMLLRARARTPGETTIEVSQVGPTDGPPQRRVKEVFADPVVEAVGHEPILGRTLELGERELDASVVELVEDDCQGLGAGAVDVGDRLRRNNHATDVAGLSVDCFEQRFLEIGGVGEEQRRVETKQQKARDPVSVRVSI